jgi:hypothetical protein
VDVVLLVIGCLRFHAAGQIEDFDLPEFGRVAFGLKGDVALSERRAILLYLSSPG